MIFKKVTTNGRLKSKGNKISQIFLIYSAITIIPLVLSLFMLFFLILGWTGVLNSMVFPIIVSVFVGIITSLILIIYFLFEFRFITLINQMYQLSEDERLEEMKSLKILALATIGTLLGEITFNTLAYIRFRNIILDIYKSDEQQAKIKKASLLIILGHILSITYFGLFLRPIGYFMLAKILNENEKFDINIIKELKVIIGIGNQ